MTFKIATGDKDGRATHWWACFLTYADWGNTYDLQATLDSYNSKAKCDNYQYIGGSIEFETEADFTVFVLRWT